MTDSSSIQTFSVGGVISRGFSIYFRNLSSFVPLSFIAYIPVWIGLLIFGSDLAAPGTPGAAEPGLSAGLFVVLLLIMLGGYWLQAALVYGTVSTMRGNSPSLGESLGQALRSLVLVIPLAIVITILVGIGLVLLIVPGIILILMFWVAIPAAVVERGGIGASLTRSRELTSGHRWSILLLVVLLAIIMAVIGAILGAVAGAVGGTGGIWIHQIGNLFVGGITAAIIAVSYHDLRILKEGGGAEAIGRAFD